MSILSVNNCRKDFVALDQKVHGYPLVYLDNAATTHKPSIVIDALVSFYQKDNANINRGVHTLSWRASEAYDQARLKLKSFIGAREEDALIFTRGTTDAINMIASAFGENNLKPGDEIIISEMEHHSNIVPWQRICQLTGATLKVIPVLDDGQLDLNMFEHLLNEKTRLVSVSHISNVLGTVNPVRQITAMAHKFGARVIIDGAQAIAHQKVDVQEINCDAYVFSGHKMYGPTGVGVCYLRSVFSQCLSVYQTGGGMIEKVSLESSTYMPPPWRFEAGTPPIAQVVGLAKAVDYMLDLGLDAIMDHHHKLSNYAMQKLQEIENIHVYGPKNYRAGVFSWHLDYVHAHDVATILDQHGVAVRAGHHCTQPLMTRFNVPAMSRASIACYNTSQDIDGLVDALEAVQSLFGEG